MLARLLYPEVEVTKSLSNVIKSNFVSILEQKKSIETVDVNHARILNKVPLSENETQKKSEDSETADGFEPSNYGVNETIKTDKEKQAQKEKEAPKSPEQLLMEARETCDAIIEEAKIDAENQRETIKAAAYDEGYQEGMARTEAILAENQDQFQQERKAFEEEYRALVKSVEPRMVQLVIKLVEKLVGYSIASQEIIEFIIKKGFEEIELTGHICIRVSEADYEYVLAHQNTIFKNVSAKTSTEILLDYNLSQTDCIIETDIGNIDCSLENQLRRLTTELNLIRESLTKE